MKKLFKLLTVAIFAVAAAVACVVVVVVAGCNSKSDEGATADYTFYIQYEDGKAVNGQTGGVGGGKVKTQICLPDGMCVTLYGPGIEIFPDKDGKLELSQDKVNDLFNSKTDVTVFTFHVMSVPEYKADCEIEVNGKNTYTIKLSK